MTLPKKNRLLLFALCFLLLLPGISWVRDSFQSNITDINVLEIDNYPVILQTYREPTLTNLSTPFGSPLGGRGLENTTITGYYQDAGYKTNFGKDHWGIDLIPSKNYYDNSWVYLNSGRRVFFSTHSGTAEYFVDQYGANYLQITNLSETFRTLYVHMEASYIRTGQKVDAGQVIGIMGRTGNATGIHLHYAIQVKGKNGKWIYTNPEPYIGRQGLN